MTRAVRAMGALLLASALAGCAAGPPRADGSVARTPGAGAAEPSRGERLLPARIRRLTNLELERSLAALTGLEVALAAELPPEVRQDGYTPNAEQDVSASWAVRYSALVHEIAGRAAREKLPSLAPCHEGPPCPATLVARLGGKAYRRPLDAAERASLESIFALGEDAGGGIAGGLELLLRALAESPSFLYVTELGEGGPPGTRVRLDAYETASALSYTLRGGPPDGELLDAARLGALASGPGRAREARRLLGLFDTRHQFRRFVLEWLEVDGLLQTAKSARLFPAYEALKPHLLAETEGFVDEVMVHGGASVRALLGAGFASVDPEAARFYGLHTYGPRASLAGTGRVGVLQQASFLAAHAHEDVTSPVKRGDFVMRKLLCEQVKRPAEIGLEVVMPAPSGELTNRQRFAFHGAEPACAACHDALDELGFTFEGFDAMGGAQGRDHGHPVVTEASAVIRGREWKLASSAALSRALAGEPSVAGCFARQAFRYFSAQSDPAVESAFVDLWSHLGEGARDNLFEALLAYVASDLFVLREVRAP